MRFSNLHTHTIFSDGKGSVRDNIESAIKKNMSSLGFSDHSFTACDTSYCMKLENYKNYQKLLSEMKEEYKDRLPIFTGIEKDFYSDINSSDFDYVLASIHYIIKGGVCYPIDHSPAQQEKCFAEAFGGNKLDFAKCYYDMATEHIIKCKPDVVGHFDVINKFSLMPEDDERYIELALASTREILKVCPVFELNTGGISRGWRKTPYPAPSVLDLILAEGGEIAINSDSHTPENLDFYFRESVEILKSHGFDHIVEFTGNGFKKVYFD